MQKFDEHNLFSLKIKQLLFGQIRSTSVLFSPVRSTSVRFGPIQSNLVYSVNFGPL